MNPLDIGKIVLEGAGIANNLRGLIQRALKAGAKRETMRIILDADSGWRLAVWAEQTGAKDVMRGSLDDIVILRCADLEPEDYKPIIRVECSPVISVFEGEK